MGEVLVTDAVVFLAMTLAGFVIAPFDPTPVQVQCVDNG